MLSQEGTNDKTNMTLQITYGKCNTLKNIIILFCKSTSVRGMSKLYSGPVFLRCIWLVFVFSMSSLLISSTTLLIKDFLDYDISVDTRLHLDESSPFPALTVCHQPPFSGNAYKLWNTSTILSPSKFNRYMRNLVLRALQSNKIDMASSIWGYDGISVYYQSLQYREAIQLGHTPAIFLGCLRGSELTISYEDDCTLLEEYRVYRFSHHTYMNCYTFEPATLSSANETTHFNLIVSMGPPDRQVTMQQAFFADVFHQARGLRIAIHEPGTFPDLEKNGLYVEPGKLNEVNYEPVRWNRLNTPKQPCLVPNVTHQYHDLERIYNYTHEQCLLRQQQKEIMRNCRCIYVLHPRPQLPSKELPYCGQLWPDYNETELTERLTCLGNFLRKEVKQKYDGTACLPVCSYYEYPSTSSIAKWRGYPWQLYWLRVQNQASQALRKFHEQWPNKSVHDLAAYKQWEVYLNYQNLTHIPKRSEPMFTPGQIDLSANSLPENIDFESDSFAYVVVKRKSAHILEKAEKLVLSFYVLVSRVGGLCSLTIGLTAAFVIEMLEFLYLVYEHR